jgi:SAM-dependent methyltransferase
MLPRLRVEPRGLEATIFGVQTDSSDHLREAMSASKPREVMPRRPWNHNIHYYDIVLRSVPPVCQRALDVGCGTGFLARRLVYWSERVVGIDVNLEMLSRRLFQILSHAFSRRNAGSRGTPSSIRSSLNFY